MTIGAYSKTKVATSQARNQNFLLYSSGPARSRAMCADPASTGRGFHLMLLYKAPKDF
jgi:hypothetical protein